MPLFREGIAQQWLTVFPSNQHDEHYMIADRHGVVREARVDVRGHAMRAFRGAFGVNNHRQRVVELVTLEGELLLLERHELHGNIRTVFFVNRHNAKADSACLQLHMIPLSSQAPVLDQLPVAREEARNGTGQSIHFCEEQFALDFCEQVPCANSLAVQQRNGYRITDGAGSIHYSPVLFHGNVTVGRTETRRFLEAVSMDGKMLVVLRRVQNRRHGFRSWLAKRPRASLPLHQVYIASKQARRSGGCVLFTVAQLNRRANIYPQVVPDSGLLTSRLARALRVCAQGLADSVCRSFECT